MNWWIAFALTEYAIGFLVALGILRPSVNAGVYPLSRAILVSVLWFPINLLGVLLYITIRINRWRTTPEAGSAKQQS
jgi:hypothetical protein